MDLSSCEKIKENIGIKDFLERLNYGPGKKVGKEIFYRSMIREGDKNPSFAVNPTKEKWFDHGTGQGGNIIDLAMLIYRTDSVSDVIRIFNEIYGSDVFRDIPHQTKREVSPSRASHIIRHLRPLGNNQALSAYLQERGIEREAVLWGLQEVYYDYIGKEGTIKRYFGIGWQNESDGWDIRNKYGKICIPPKDILVRYGNLTASVFEGMLNCLSAMQENPLIAEHTVIVMNSLSMSIRAITWLKEHPYITAIDLYLDHGKGGRNFTDVFQKELPVAIDRSSLYAGYGDYNDKIRDKGNLEIRRTR